MKLFRISLMLMLVIGMFSCSDINKQLEEMIPADSRGVVRIDLKSVLDKGQLIDDDGKVAFPPALKNLIDSNDASPAADAISLLKKIGVVNEACVYVFFPKNTFDFAALIAVNEADEAKQEIEKRTGQKFQTVEKVDFLRNGSVSYVFDDDILFIGKETKEDADAQLALTVQSYLHKSSNSIADDADIADCIHRENDVNAYFSVSGIHNAISKSETLTEAVKKFPMITLFTDSDIKAITMHLNFQKEGAEFNAYVKADKKSDYLKLIDATMAKADPSFLKVIPVSMNYIFSISVNGENLMKLDQVKKSVNLLSNLLPTDKFDLRKLIKSIDGPVAIAFSAGDGVNISSVANDNWNLAIAAKSKDAANVVNGIVQFASDMGQQDYVKNGRHLFSYQGMPVYLGSQDSVVYAIRIDHELEEEFYYDTPDVKERFAESQLGFFAKVTEPQGESFINFGLKNATEGNGLFYSMRDDNPVVIFLEILCQINRNKEQKSSEYFY